ncbi:Ger(x)C family spore germination protein [Paenibacillus sp. PAMC21692]|uniref:Ger(x)C family spore germination protein n=1 Tax=Paenibacillus sp. PAMC21692 TaxID=2762320 RepID=UPI00164DEA88|nr:Ger(x)C family spore germination protein [Paenibacillus sp. PAMC21692]QNK55913.1 Ger(x)C family spore germination protein [Paenibacillus sp. PAMC21692]
MSCQWTKSVKLSCIILLIVPFLTGCWDRLEIEERAVILGISIDLAKPGAEKEEEEVSHLRGSFPTPEGAMIRLAAQIALPGRIPLGPGEGGGSSGGPGQTVWVVDVVGHSVDDALLNLQQQISSKLFYGHLRVIVISEALARNGLQNVNDILRRNSEVRRTLWIMISKGNARKIMTASPKLERVPSLYLLSTLDNAVKLGKFPIDYVGLFWSNSSKKGQEGFLPYVGIMKEQNINLLGLAYFKDDKLVGTTKPFEIAGYMGIKGLNPAGYRGVVKTEEGAVMIVATHRKSKFEVRIENGRPHFKVYVQTEINLEEKITGQLVVNEKTIKDIQNENKKSLKKSYESLIKQTQQKGSDIFGFGEYLRAKKPKYWDKEIGSADRWQEAYMNVEIEVSVKTRVRRVGMKSK